MTAAEVELIGKEIRAVLAGPQARRVFAAMAAARQRGEEPDPRPLYRLLGERRLLAVSWPRAYGGRELSGRCAAAVVDELVAGGVPEVLHTLSVQICGNFLLGAGTAEQRSAVLPGLARGQLAATVLYSEIEAGSDLSALRTAAEPTGDGGWRITGRKVYSVKTAFADLALVAARTSAEVTPYQGITLFLVRLAAPGVRIGVLASTADEDFADVTLDGVEVSAGAVVGPVGGAWPLITEALALERTGVDYVAKAELWLRLGNGPTVDRAEYGRLRTHAAAARALSRRCVDQQDTGAVDPVLAAVTKYWCSETARSVAWWCTDTGGALGTERLRAAYREAPGLTLSAGTSEMMLELVANSGLPTPGAGVSGDEPLAAELRKAVRAVASLYDDRDPVCAWWPDLARIGVLGLSTPAEHGGLGLGLRAAVVCCAELGRELHDAGFLDTLTAIDAMVRSGRPEVAAALTGHWRASIVDTEHGGADALLVTAEDGRALGFVAPDGVDVLCRDGAAADVLAAAAIRRAAWLSGLAAGCLAHTVQRTRIREQFGRPLIENQDVAFRLARLKVRHDAVTALIDELAGQFDDGGADSALIAGALAEAGALALAASREGVQLHGAAGMTVGSPAGRYYLAAPSAVAAAGPVAVLRAEAGAC